MVTRRRALAALAILAALAAAPSFADVSLAEEAEPVCPGGSASPKLRVESNLNTAALFTIDARLTLPTRSLRASEVLNIGTGATLVHAIDLRLNDAPPGTYPLTVTVSADVAPSPEVVRTEVVVKPCPGRGVKAQPAPQRGSPFPAAGLGALAALVLVLGGVVARLRRSGSGPAQAAPYLQGYYQPQAYRRF